MSDDDIRRDAEHVAGCSEDWCHAAGESDLFDAVRRGQLVAAAWLRANPPADARKPDSWQWVYMPTCIREKGGKLELKNTAGQVAATVFTHPGASNMFKYVWFVWDQSGTGGENSAEPTVDEAIREAEAAVRRWDQFTITETH